MISVIFCADIGTSSLKAAYIDLEGRELAFVRVPYTHSGPVEAGDWEAALAQALGRLGGESRPAAVCISGNGPTLVPVTGSGEALAPLHWYDPRIQTPPVEQAGGVRPSFFLPRAAWFMTHHPADYGRTWRLFSCQEYLAFTLGAEPVTVLPQAAYEPYYWDDAQCALFGLDPARFPPMAALGSVIGKTSAGARRRFGLPEGIPIIAGGPDFTMALIGAGVLEPGMVCDRAGSSEGINLCTASPAAAPGLRVLPHAAAGLWNLGAVLPVSGRLFDWYRLITSQENRPYGDLLEEITVSGTAPGKANGFFFHQAGAFTLRFPQGLPDRAGLGRAALESLGFMVSDTLDGLAARGFSITEMRLSGGQGKSSLWNRLKADITGVRLLAMEIPDGELAGDACAAALALGEAATIQEAAARIVRVKAVFEPDPARHEAYRERYAAYREMERIV